MKLSLSRHTAAPRKMTMPQPVRITDLLPGGDSLHYRRLRLQTRKCHEITTKGQRDAHTTTDDMKLRGTF